MGEDVPFLVASIAVLAAFFVIVAVGCVRWIKSILGRRGAIDELDEPHDWRTCPDCRTGGRCPATDPRPGPTGPR